MPASGDQPPSQSRASHRFTRESGAGRPLAPPDSSDPTPTENADCHRPSSLIHRSHVGQEGRQTRAVWLERVRKLIAGQHRTIRQVFHEISVRALRSMRSVRRWHRTSDQRKPHRLEMFEKECDTTPMNPEAFLVPFLALHNIAAPHEWHTPELSRTLQMQTRRRRLELGNAWAEEKWTQPIAV